ncbi:galactokinase [Desulfopila aestuarii]|uniref:Galactokinase n=1 Tax=Desulfopila aestuarii DSM 18488 TaxID=1121416 RepID=A0A1M7XX82_9BACT|nr:galactokinase [Desulfopila aestuarii]SHO43487.1 galactokinase [Desulfopila aestuarii DSM 18488]
MRAENPSTILEQELSRQFKQHFDSIPELVVTSPGRVNIIGEYTDFNDGFVLPMAIDRSLMMAIKKRTDDLIRVYSTEFNAEISFTSSSLRKGEFSWGEYITGCIWVLQQMGHTPCGFDMVITGNIPVGASLSSSAALELGILRAATYTAGIDWQPMKMAILGQRVENEWVGMNCGIMDQAICACGRKDHALLIDCRDHSSTLCPLPKKSTIIILDTGTRRGLVDSAYNERRAQCFEAAGKMNIAYLRDGNEEMLEQFRPQLSPLAYLRAKHIILENDRVLQAAKAMQNDAGHELGRLMYESHCSLRDDFDVSGTALNTMVECAMEHSACLGARMTGAGFAGCAVALVEKGREKDFVEEVSSAYAARMQTEPRLYVCQAADGTGIQPFDQELVEK